MATDKKEDYVDYNCFDPFVYTKKRYATVNDWNSQPLKLLHNIFQSCSILYSNSVQPFEGISGADTAISSSFYATIFTIATKK